MTEKLVIFLTTELRRELCESESGVLEVPDFGKNGSRRIGLEEYGRDWAKIWPTDIVMLVEEEEVTERGGIRFEVLTGDIHGYTVLDLNYGVKVGVIKLVEGPGWVLEQIGTTFLDLGQMKTIIAFIENQKEFGHA